MLISPRVVVSSSVHALSHYTNVFRTVIPRVSILVIYVFPITFLNLTLANGLSTGIIPRSPILFSFARAMEFRVFVSVITS